MWTFLTTLAVAVLIVAFVLALWTAVHLWSVRKIGVRTLGCKGAPANGDGDSQCCHCSSKEHQVR